MGPLLLIKSSVLQFFRFEVERGRFSRSDHSSQNAYRPRYTYEDFLRGGRRGRFEVAASIALLEIIEGGRYRGQIINLKFTESL